MKTVSVIIPCRNEENSIRECLCALASCNGVGTDFLLELLVIDGLSDDRTREIVQQVQYEGLPVKLIDNPNKITPFALNIGLHEAIGEYVMIASAHSSFEPNYISTLLDAIFKLNADGVGGYMQTIVRNITRKSMAIKEVMSCPWGVGNSSFRTGVDRITQVDTVPFGLYKRNTLIEAGGYNERLVRNHDMELSKRLIAAGKRIFLIPDAHCRYYVRDTYHAICKNNFGNGLWNILTVKITGDLSSLSLRHFIPLLFLLSLVLPALTAIFYTPLAYISLASLVLYIFVMLVISVKLAVTKRQSFQYILWTFFVLHFSYATGSFVGIFTNPNKYQKKGCKKIDYVQII